jgi:hypothetical protein
MGSGTVHGVQSACYPENIVFCPEIFESNFVRISSVRGTARTNVRSSRIPGVCVKERREIGDR